MKNFYFPLFLLSSLLMFVVSAKAEYISEQFAFSKVQGGQSAYVELDFSRYDLSDTSDFTLEFPLGLTSSFYFTNDDYGGDFEIPADTAYTGTLDYKLEITADNGKESLPLTDSTTSNNFDVTYVIEDAVNLSEGETYRTQSTQSTLPSELTLTANEFFALLDSNNHLNLNLVFSGPQGNLENFEYPAGIASGFRVENLVGEVTVSFNAPSVTPEPATLFIFGAAIILGLPLVRHFRRKEKINT